MMRTVVVAFLLLAPLLSGCLGWFDDDEEREAEPTDVGYDAEEVEVSNVVVTDTTVQSFDLAELSLLVYEPRTTTHVGDELAPFPVVILLSGLGFPKEAWENDFVFYDDPLPLPPTNLMQKFADAGFITVTYDARGHYQSGGMSTLIGPAEQADLDAVIDFILANYRTNGNVGLAGWSLGGAAALRGLADNPHVVTAVPHAGFVAMDDAFTPGGVPKLEWYAGAYGLGAVGTQLRLDDDIHAWPAAGVTRQGIADVVAQQELRGLQDASTLTKPVFACHGMQDSLSTDIHKVWEQGLGFARVYYYAGGHFRIDGACWDKTVEWFQFFLAGIDTEVDAWPAIEAVDATGDPAIAHEQMPIQTMDTYHLEAPDLLSAEPGESTFDVSQQLLANPLHEPSLVWDLVGQGYQEVPAQFRQDPTATLFSTAPLSATTGLVGAPRLYLQASNATADGPYQVVATMYAEKDGNLIMLGRTAGAVYGPEDHENGWIALEFPWTKMDLSAGDSIVVKVGANDPTMFGIMPTNYSVTFQAGSHLVVPVLAPVT